MISTCFPHPGNPNFGVWALRQAEAITADGADLKIVSPTSYVPRFLGRQGLAPWAALCPSQALVGPFNVSFPRWFHYYAGPMKPIIRRWPLPIFALGWPHLKRALLNEVTLHKPHVIFANHSLDGGEAARRLQQATGIPFVVAEHDFGEITDCERMHARHRYYDRIMAAASSVLSVSERMHADIQRIFPNAHVVLARYGQYPIPDDLTSTPRPSLRSGKLTVLCAGSLTPRKGVEVLVRAFCQVASIHQNAELRIAGDGPERASILSCIRRFGLQDRVHLLGCLPHRQLLQEMVWADAFAMVAWDEPFGVVYSEAFAAGLPVVCCNDGGICDIMMDGIHGFCVPPRDVGATAKALLQLLRDPESRQRMSTAATKLFRDHLSTTRYSQTLLRELMLAQRHPSAIGTGDQPTIQHSDRQ